MNILRIFHRLLFLPALLIASIFQPSDLAAQAGYDIELTDAPYRSLQNATRVPMTLGAVDTYLLEIPGQPFHFFGTEYVPGETTPFQIGGRGFISINDKAEDPQLVVFDGLFTPMDSLDERSAISYVLEGEPGNHVLRVEWSYGRLTGGDGTEWVNFQINIHQQSGIVEAHFGPSSQGSSEGFESGPWVGIFTAPASFTSMTRKFWLLGDPAMPSIDSSRTISFPSLGGTPAEGTIYRFIPRTLSDAPEKDAVGLLHLYPNPTPGPLFLNTRPAPFPWNARVLALDGRTLISTIAKEGSPIVDLSPLPTGVYLVEISRGERRYTELIMRK